MNETMTICIVCGRVFPLDEAEFYKKKTMCCNCWDNFLNECAKKDKEKKYVYNN